MLPLHKKLKDDISPQRNQNIQLTNFKTAVLSLPAIFWTMTFYEENYKARYGHSTTNPSRSFYTSTVHYGRSKRRRLQIGDVTLTKHEPSSMIQSSVRILEEGLFERNPPDLLLLKTFPDVLDEDIPDDDAEKPRGFSLADPSWNDETALLETETVSSGLPTTLNQLETLDICLKTFLNRIQESGEAKQKQFAAL